MSVPILSSIFGEKPNIVPFNAIDYGESQLKSIMENLKAFPQIQALGDYFQKYMTDAYNKAIPNFSSLLEMGGKTSEEILKAAEPLIHGEVPPDVQSALMRSGAFQALGKGGDFIHSLQARDIARTSQDEIKFGTDLVGAAGSAAQKWAGLASGLIMNPAGFLITPAQQANLDLQQSLIKREVKQAQENVNAAPNPIAKGLSDLVAYLTASYIGHGPAGKPPAATDYSGQTSVASGGIGGAFAQLTGQPYDIMGGTGGATANIGYNAPAYQLDASGAITGGGPGSVPTFGGGPFGGGGAGSSGAGSTSDWGGLYQDAYGNPYPATTSAVGLPGTVSSFTGSIGGPNAGSASSVYELLSLLQGAQHLIRLPLPVAALIQTTLGTIKLMPEFAPIDVPQGPLIQAHIPQITGAESPKLEDPGAAIVAAAAKGAEINGRVRSMESRLLQMQLEEKNKDIEHGLAVQRMAQQNSQFAQNLFLKDKQVQSLADERDWKQRKYYDSLKDQGDYSAELQKIDPSDPTAWNQALEVKSRHPEGANTPGGRRMEFYIGDQYNKRTAAEKAAANSDLKNIDTYMKNLNWQGFHPTSEPLDNPNYWVPAYKTKPDGTDDLDAQGNRQIDPDHKTYMIGKDQAGNPRYMTQPTAVIDDYIARWQKAKAAFRKEQITDYQSGIKPYPVDHTGGTAGAIPLPRDQSQWIMHQPYVIKGRTYMWDGANMNPIQ